MLKFYHNPHCPKCGEIQDVLEAMNFAHQGIAVKNSNEIGDDDFADKKLPMLIDDNKIFEGSEAILQHLEELKGFKELWDKFQSDACYCGDEGEIE